MAIERGATKRPTLRCREVLGLLLASPQPLGAYEIMERLAPDRRRAPPMTVYRALKFLCGNGFVHRIESRNAYLGCRCPHAAGDVVMFMICDRCGAVAETSSAQAASIVKSAARKAGFTPKSSVIEISGICTHCREKRDEDQSARPLTRVIRQRGG